MLSAESGPVGTLLMTWILLVTARSAPSEGRFTRTGPLAPARRIASDVDGAISDAFGTWVEKSMYGRKYMGMERSTFLVDAVGKVIKVWRKIKVPGHAEAVLAAVKAL